MMDADRSGDGKASFVQKAQAFLQSLLKALTPVHQALSVVEAALFAPAGDMAASPSAKPAIAVSPAIKTLVLWLPLLVIAIFFALWPELDLAASCLFYCGHHQFLANNDFGDFFRTGLFWLPFAVLLCYGAMFMRKYLGYAEHGPSKRAMLFLVLSFVVGPGLLVNGVIKDVSHRPRPVQTAEFGGHEAFRPWYRFDGACKTNCSFISGETATAFWLLAPASLAPPPIRPALMTAAISLGIVTGLLRLAFGGHYLSDVVMAALIMIVVLRFMRRWIDPLSHAPDL